VGSDTSDRSQNVSNSKAKRLERSDTEGDRFPRGWNMQCLERNRWPVEPNVDRVAHGVSKRMDRLKSLGNAIVPQVAYQILKSIVEVDNSLR
jgi:DNA (cytosine-5)-methyltransferase 1